MNMPQPTTSTFARPYVVSWNLTYRCNLACEHCYLDAGGAPQVGTENFADTFTYTIDDGSGDTPGPQNIGTVTVTVTPVNDAPIAVDDSYSTFEGGTLIVDDPLGLNTPMNPNDDGLLTNDFDAENGKHFKCPRTLFGRPGVSFF